jgi:predicted RNA methylase
MRKLVLLLAACGALASMAQAGVMANWVRQYFTNTPTGKQVLVCVYAYNGKEYERVYDLGTACPTYITLE